MRRLVISVATACGLALLTACSGGGYGFSTGGNANGSIDQIVFSAGTNAQADSFLVVPQTALVPTAYLEVSALGQKGSGVSAVVVPDATFTWGARFVDPATDPLSVASYQVGTNGTKKPCPKKPSTTPAIPIYIKGTNLQYTALAPGQSARVVEVPGPAGMSALDNATGFCIVLNATHLGDGVQGSQTILVSNNP